MVAGIAHREVEADRWRGSDIDISIERSLLAQGKRGGNVGVQVTERNQGVVRRAVAAPCGSPRRTFSPERGRAAGSRRASYRSLISPEPEPDPGCFKAMTSLMGRSLPQIQACLQCSMTLFLAQCNIAERRPLARANDSGRAGNGPAPEARPAAGRTFAQHLSPPKSVKELSIESPVRSVIARPWRMRRVPNYASARLPVPQTLKTQKSTGMSMPPSMAMFPASFWGILGVAGKRFRDRVIAGD